ncbi:MAG: hypothetical protein LLG05_10460 [Porphyromonadaceae bacterium]|nr:hypothetical protein [Porphyromonadaceae bacterium]
MKTNANLGPNTPITKVRQNSKNCPILETGIKSHRITIRVSQAVVDLLKERDCKNSPAKVYARYICEMLKDTHCITQLMGGVSKMGHFEQILFDSVPKMGLGEIQLKVVIPPLDYEILEEISAVSGKTIPDICRYACLIFGTPGRSFVPLLVQAPKENKKESKIPQKVTDSMEEMEFESVTDRKKYAEMIQKIANSRYEPLFVEYRGTIYTTMPIESFKRSPAEHYVIPHDLIKWEYIDKYLEKDIPANTVVLNEFVATDTLEHLDYHINRFLTMTEMVNDNGRISFADIKKIMLKLTE